MPGVKAVKKTIVKKKHGGTGTQSRPAGARGQPGQSASGASCIPTNKKHGQHLLKNPGIIDKIVSASDIKTSDTIFEIGPGTGNLTMRLLEAGKRVIAYEIDPRMASEVRKRAQGAGRMNLDIQEGDVLRKPWPAFDVCAANLPYQISSPFVFKLLAHRPSFRCAVLMFQKEFAERLIAQVGDKQYGRLAVNTRLFVKVTCVCKVSRGSFTPPPEVDSMVVKVVPRDPPIQVDFREWDGLMRICFLRKNKMLRAAFGLSHTVKILEQNYTTWCALTGTKPSSKPMKEQCYEVLASLGLLERRAIKVDLDTFFRLLLEFNKQGIHFTNASPGVKIGSKASVAELPEEFFLDDAPAAGDDMED